MELILDKITNLEDQIVNLQELLDKEVEYVKVLEEKVDIIVDQFHEHIAPKIEKANKNIDYCPNEVY